MQSIPKSFTGLSTIIDSWTRRLSLSILVVIIGASPCWAKLHSVEIVGNPSVNNDRVTLRVKAKQEDGRPVLDLKEGDFKVIVDEQPIKLKPKNWKSSKEAIPPPVWIVFLLDYSGSMKGLDTKGSTKLAGAIKAIEQFTQAALKRGGSTNVSIVPFGDGKAAACNKAVTPTELNNFFPVGDAKIKNQLDNLLSGTPCAATNIYDPVTATVNFFNNPQDIRFHPPEGTDVQPRTTIVLLSDGYHNKPNESADFERLIGFLEKNDSVVIHTLGYGQTPDELGRKYGLNRSARRSDVGLRSAGKRVPEEEFVDQEKLAKIASATGGIAEFSPDAKTVSEKLDLFLSAILGEYEITYNEPSPERGSKHDVKVVVSSNITEVVSLPKSYIISVFGRPVSLQKRLVMILGLAFSLIIAGGVPFWLWGKELKKETS
jgi:von Willebrand factor type A domain